MTQSAIHLDSLRSPAVTSGELSIPQLVDHLGQVKAKLKKLEPLQAEEKKLRAQLIARLDLKPADAIVAMGAKFLADVTEQQFERVITNKDRLINLLGAETYNQHSSIALRALDELLDEGQQALVLTKTQTGPRKVTVRALPIAMPAAVAKKPNLRKAA